MDFDLVERMLDSLEQIAKQNERQAKALELLAKRFESVTMELHGYNDNKVRRGIRTFDESRSG